MNDLVSHKGQAVFLLARSDCTVRTTCSLQFGNKFVFPPLYLPFPFSLAMKVDFSNLRDQKNFALHVFGGIVEREYYSVSCL